MGLEEAIWAEMSIENNQRSNIEQPNFWDYVEKEESSLKTDLERATGKCGITEAHRARYVQPR